MTAPSKFLLGLEGVRALYEFGMGWLMNAQLIQNSPKGDNHPVLVFPGLGAADGSTHYLRSFLDELGYQSHPWGMGRNLGPRQGMNELSAQLVDLIQEIYKGSGNQQVSLIGWSLGGIYSREIAKICPDLIRQVITLGSPFKGDPGGTNASMLYELLSKDKTYRDPNIIERIKVPPPVPFTSLYSKTDGVVHWECSIEDPGPRIENIEVPGASHLGMGHHPVSMFLIANRLQQKKESWKPFSG